MAKTKYDVGDILTFCVEDRCYATAVIVKWYITSTYIEEVSLEQRTDYDLFIRPDEGNFRFVREVPECVFGNYKIVGHIDISGMSNEKVKNHLDRAVASEWCEWRVAYAVMAYWSLMKIHKSEEENDYVKKEFYIPKADDSSLCRYSCNKFEKENERLKEECKQKQKHLDLANNKIFELKKEVDSLRQELHNDLTHIHNNLSKMGFTEDAIYSIMYSEFNYVLGTE